jgi:hypothetical protein
LFQGWDVLETSSLCPVPKVHQTHDSSVSEAIPKTPLRAVDLSQSMAANPAISVYALRQLLEICESHRDVEPIQYMVSTRHNLLMNSSQTGIAIGENRDRGGFVNSAMPERETNCAHSFRTSVTHERKACGPPIAIQGLAGNNFEVSFRPPVSISDISTIEADH